MGLCVERIFDFDSWPNAYKQASTKKWTHCICILYCRHRRRRLFKLLNMNEKNKIFGRRMCVRIFFLFVFFFIRSVVRLTLDCRLCKCLVRKKTTMRFFFHSFENGTNDHESERAIYIYKKNNRRLSNGKMLCEQMREFTDDTELYYILCLNMTDNATTWTEHRKKNIIVLRKKKKEIHKIWT